jgi:hypothetical protein
VNAVYLGVAPLGGSMLLGYLWAYGGASLLTGALIALAQLQLYKFLADSRAIKQIWVPSRAARVRGSALGIEPSAAG